MCLKKVKENKKYNLIFENPIEITEGDVYCPIKNIPGICISAENNEYRFVSRSPCSADGTISFSIDINRGDVLFVEKENIEIYSKYAINPKIYPGGFKTNMGEGEKREQRTLLKKILEFNL